MSDNLSAAPTTAAIPGHPPGTWKADPAHSEIAFSVRQFLVDTVRGRFTGYDVTIVTSKDPLDSSVTATIDLASIDTGNERRDKHLRSASYFDVAKHPAMGYRSTGIRRTDDGWVVDGELTFHGITRQVPLSVEAKELAPTPTPALSDGLRAGFCATARIDRRDFGLDISMDGGGALIGAKTSISLTIEAVLQKRP